MNLTTDPWIPIIWKKDGKPDTVSLRDAFLHGEDIRDLACRPHERIALMRLLICVAQAALDGPLDRAVWKTCRAILPQKAADYLRDWKDAFELLGPGPRFLQVEGVKNTKQTVDAEGNDIAKLDLDLASGNVSTLFDTAGGSERSFSPGRVALMLLTFQCFSPGGLLSECMWAGRRTKKAGNVVAPCLANRMVHTFVFDRGCFLNQIWSNLVTRDSLHAVPWGHPIWEMMPTSPDMTSSEAENALGTYLGRLVPVSRSVSLSDDLRSVTWGCGLEYLPFGESGWRDPFATIYKDTRDEKQPRKVLSVSLDRALWRELHAIASLTETEEGTTLGGAYPLAALGAESGDCDIWSGGLVDKQKSKIVDAVESVLHVPSEMFTDDGRRLYEKGVRISEDCASQLRRAVSTYRHALKDELDRKETRKRGMEVKRKAAMHYWTAIEQEVRQLLAIVEHTEQLGPDLTNPQWQATAWSKALFNVARDAYDLACPHSTPRQLKAYALGLQVIIGETPEVTNETDEPETDDTTEA